MDLSPPLVRQHDHQASHHPGRFAGRFPSANQTLADRYDVVELWKFPDRKAALAEHGKGITAIVTSANFGANAELINALPDLKKAICSWGL